jgi:hypothetical protein
VAAALNGLNSTGEFRRILGDQRTYINLLHVINFLKTRASRVAFCSLISVVPYAREGFWRISDTLVPILACSE